MISAREGLWLTISTIQDHAIDCLVSLHRHYILLLKALCVQFSSKCPAPAKGEIIHYYAVNRWDDEDVFDEYARPQHPLSPEADRILGFTDDQLANCQTTDQVLGNFLHFIEG